MKTLINSDLPFIFVIKLILVFTLTVGFFLIVKNVYSSAPAITTSLTITSSNNNPAYAKVDDIVSVNFITNQAVSNVVVAIDNNEPDTLTNNGNEWTATRIMQSGDFEGIIPFTIDFEDISGNGSFQLDENDTTDSSAVIFDETSPTYEAGFSRWPYVYEGYQQSIFIEFNEEIGDSLTPQVAMYGEAENLELTDMEKASKVLYWIQWTVGSGDGLMIPHVVAQDLAGNIVINPSSNNAYNIVDNTAPLVNEVLPNTLYSSDVGEVVVDIHFNENMANNEGEILVEVVGIAAEPVIVNFNTWVSTTSSAIWRGTFTLEEDIIVSLALRIYLKMN